MKKLFYISATLVSVLFCTPVFAQLGDDDKKLPEVIITGDSWAAIPCFVGAVQNAFWERHVYVDIHDCLKTSHIGGRADNYKNDYAYAETIKKLKENPLVKVIWLSEGGNDMFAYWNKNMTPAEENALFDKIRLHIQEAVDDFHKLRPDVWVLVSGYDFVYIHPNNPISAYRKIFEHMGEPTPGEVHGALARLAQNLTQLKGDHTVFQHHMGLMQYYYGIPDAGVKAKMTAAPNLISPPSNPAQLGGNYQYRNNKFAMAHIFKFYFDPHHIRPKGYKLMFEHSIDTYIGQWINGKAYRRPFTQKPENLNDDEVSPELQRQAVEMLSQEFN
jgi:hypothetical protein